MLKERDTAIDFVKLIAIFLVINSHMSICYGDYSYLASGGAIGDALFSLLLVIPCFLAGRPIF